MSKEFQKLQREIRADLALIYGHQSSSNTRLEAMAKTLETHAEQIAKQGEQIAEQGRQIRQQGWQIRDSMKATATLAMEVVGIGNQMVGRFKQLDQRFGKLFGAMEKEMVSQKSFQALEKRVARLEAKGDPAA